MLKEEKINTFLNKLGDKTASPSGGAVSALLSALSSSLSLMMLNFTINKKGYEKNKEKFLEISNKFSEKKNIFLNLMDEDAKSVDEIIKTYSMPKNTSQEIKIKNDLAQKAYVKAIQIPLEIAENTLSLFDDIEFIMKYGNKNLVTDALSSAIIANCAVETALLNVKINLKSIEDLEYREKTTNKIKNIENKSKSFLNKIYEISDF